jgi:deazaflavin-dependent oxidoreductase (nitroreductase family)
VSHDPKWQSRIRILKVPFRFMRPYNDYKRWLYRGDRPHGFARLLNRASAIAFETGIWPNRATVLEVRGRRSGRTISFPVVIADYEGDRYLVSMLGKDANWVRNVRAAGGGAVLRHGGREAVRLEEVSVDARPAILRRYLAVAPGARPHIPVDRHAPLEEFEKISPQVPVFRITAAPTTPTSGD